MLIEFLLYGLYGWIGYRIARRLLGKHKKKCSCVREGTPAGTGPTTQLELGEDPNCSEMSEVTMWKCGGCDEFFWLRYLIEQPQYSKAGRYWEVKISAKDAEGFSADNAKRFIEDQDWCIAGGSYYDQGRHIQTRPIAVN